MTLDLHRVEAMVVTPSRAVHQILKEVLWDSGLRQLPGLPTGAAALEAMRDRPPDLAFVDMTLADGPGTALVRRLRRAPDSPAPFIPVIMTIAEPTLAKTLAARDSGADAMVTRPITMKGVMQHLAALSLHPRGIVLSPAYIGPDRRRDAGRLAPGAAVPGEERRDPRRRDIFELAPMPLLAMAQRGEREAAERLVSEARQVLRSLRLAWIDAELGPVRAALAAVSSRRDLEAARPRLRDGLEAAAAAMADHGFPEAAAIALELERFLGRAAASDRLGQLLKVNADRLHALLRARPAEAEQLAAEIATTLRLPQGPGQR